MFPQKVAQDMAKRILAVEYCPLDSLRSDPQDPRLHSKRQVRHEKRGTPLQEPAGAKIESSNKESRASAGENRNLFSTEKLCDIWKKIGSNPRARRALKRLD